jgi:hypothetical protein
MAKFYRETGTTRPAIDWIRRRQKQTPRLAAAFRLPDIPASVGMRPYVRLI